MRYCIDIDLDDCSLPYIHQICRDLSDEDRDSEELVDALHDMFGEFVGWEQLDHIRNTDIKKLRSSLGLETDADTDY